MKSTTKTQKTRIIHASYAFCRAIITNIEDNSFTYFYGLKNEDPTVFSENTYHTPIEAILAFKNQVKATLNIN